tara:strand:- start:3386 stop:3682 length:297 start_codon:yes stop_codon:yes gene_type:complete
MESTVQIRQKVKKYIRETIAKSGIKKNGYRCEYKIMPKDEDWDGSFYTFNEAVNVLIEMEKAEWDIWLTCYDSDSRDEPIDLCMFYQPFDINQVIGGK